MYAFHAYADLIDKDEAGVVVLGAEAVEGFEVVNFLTDYSELLSFVVFLRLLQIIAKVNLVKVVDVFVRDFGWVYCLFDLL